MAVLTIRIVVVAREKVGSASVNADLQSFCTRLQDRVGYVSYDDTGPKGSQVVPQLATWAQVADAALAPSQKNGYTIDWTKMAGHDLDAGGTTWVTSTDSIRVETSKSSSAAPHYLMFRAV